jgi:YbbR domain-containing protein
MPKESIKTRNRKIARYMSDAYVKVIKPDVISSQHWEMWLKHNAGLTQVEIAMLYHVKKFEVVQILATVVELLKYKPKIVEQEWTQDFRVWIDAQLYRDKIRAKLHAAYKVANKSNSNQILIMSEV